jgi:hypothetical protein
MIANRQMPVLAQSQPATQNGQVKTLCPNNSSAQSNRNSNVTNGTATGFGIGLFVGGVFVPNLVGFPELEVVEVGVGSADLVLMLTSTAGGDAVAVATGGAYGAVAGGVGGAALPSGRC